MQSAVLLATYIVTVIAFQAVGFLISQIVDGQWPGASTLVFLVLFMAAFGLAWPIAVRIAEWFIRRAGYTVQTEQSGGTGRTDHVRAVRRK